MDTMEKVIIYTDGGSRGNPGPAAIGAVFCDGKGKAIKEYSETIGEGTNNEAEYKAVIFALKKAKALYGKEKVKRMEFELRSDSELMVKQLKGEYKIVNSNIQPLFLQVWNLKIDFGRLDFFLIPREENVEADKQVNKALDEGSQESLKF